MSDKHLSTQFDAELGAISSAALQMGGLAEAQVAQALYALRMFSQETASQVLMLEQRVNHMDVEIDHDLSLFIARRQPAAGDLRLLIAISKTIGNIERIGDEASRIARTAQRLIATSKPARIQEPVEQLTPIADLATSSLRRALDAFARMDVAQALDVIKNDSMIDAGFGSLVAQLVVEMKRDSEAVDHCVGFIFIAKAIERIGDHAKNMAEQVVYIVRGTDIRHTPPAGLDVAVD